VGVDVTDPADWKQASRIADLFDASTAMVPTDHTVPRLESVNVLLDVDGRLDAEFAAYRGHFVLLRPDHVVAAAWYPTETDRILPAVTAWTPEL